MSRAYRIRVRETLRRVIRATDHVSSELELLEILPQDEMAELLAAELIDRGFQRRGNLLVRQEDDVVVTVDLETGNVKVEAESSEDVKLEAEKGGVVYDRSRRAREEAKQALSDQIRQNLEREAERKREKLQADATDRLEAELAGVTSELDQAVNRATAEALKRKAAQIGQIKQMTDDPESGSLTIVVEV